MKDWRLQDRGGEVYILCGEEYHNRRKIYPDPESKARVEFWLLYNDQGKTVGYLFKYKYEYTYPKFTTYNSFGIIYNRKDRPKYTFEVIFEDSNIRLVTYDHSHQIRDYFLVGRWRSLVKEESINV
jgi:hypothetical protein